MPDGISTAIAVPAVTLLTGPGQVHDIGAEQMRFFAFTSDGILHVSRSHATHPFVLSFKSRLTQLGIKYLLRDESIDEIAARYTSTLGYQPLSTGSSGELDAERLNQAQVIALEHIRAATARRATDIHILVNETNTVVKYRIDNDLIAVHEDTFEWGNTLCYAIFQGMADVAGTHFTPTIPVSAQIRKKVPLPKELTSVRVETLPRDPHYVMYLRLMREEYVSSSLVELGFLPEQEIAIQRLQKLPNGLVLVAGPTGSGKTTTIHVVLNEMSADAHGQIQIITFEDPIELPLQGHVQVSLNAINDADRRAGFALFGRSSLRADPDVFFISEIRDETSGDLAVQGASTGHPVWASLHANSGFSAPNRLRNIGVNLRQVLDDRLLRGVIAQRLTKKLCMHCRVPAHKAKDFHPANEVDAYVAFFKQRLVELVSRNLAKPTLLNPDGFDNDVIHDRGDLDKFEAISLETTPQRDNNSSGIYFKGAGCRHCDGQGVKGRMLIGEVIEFDATLLHLLKEDRPFVAEEVWAQRGNKSMREVAIMRVLQGVICPFDADRAVDGFGIDGEDVNFTEIEKAERDVALRGRKTP